MYTLIIFYLDKLRLQNPILAKHFSEIYQGVI